MWIDLYLSIDAECMNRDERVWIGKILCAPGVKRTQSQKRSPSLTKTVLVFVFCVLEGQKLFTVSKVTVKRENKKNITEKDAIQSLESSLLGIP